MADAYRFGYPGVPNDWKKSKSFANVGCEKGSGSACYTLGYMLMQSSPPEPAAASTAISRACELGDRCDALGDLYALGVGVEKDREKAKAMYRKGCDANSISSCRAALALDNGEFFITNMELFVHASSELPEPNWLPVLADHDGPATLDIFYCIHGEGSPKVASIEKSSGEEDLDAEFLKTARERWYFRVPGLPDGTPRVCGVHHVRIEVDGKRS